jgi:hypothetical protein
MVSGPFWEQSDSGATGGEINVATKSKKSFYRK